MEQGSIVEIEDPSEEMLENHDKEKFVKDEDNRIGESPLKHEDNGGTATNQEANKEKAESPSEKEDSKKSSSPTESSKRKRIVKGKGKLTKKSLVIYSLTSAKAVEQVAEKEVTNPVVEMLESIEGEKFTDDEDKRNKESPSEHEDNSEKVESAANQEDNEEKVKSPSDREDITKKSCSPTETCNDAESSKRKKLVKGRGKVTKKSPATNSLNTIKAIEQDAKKEVDNFAVEMLESNEGEEMTKDKDMRNGSSPSKHEDNCEKVESAAYLENKEEKVKSPSKREGTMKKSGDHAEMSNKAESSKTKKLLKAKGKITKKTPVINSLSAMKAEDSPKVQARQGMRKLRKEIATQGNKKTSSKEEEAPNLSSRDNKNKTNIEEQPIQISEVAHTDIEMMAELQKGPKAVNNEKKSGASNASARKEKRKAEVGGRENSELNKYKKEKLGGLIFMCSAKTKPDCFRYQIMGVSIGKKDIVLAIKPGLMLFLYDFDLKLLYGVYRASSNGGMKLEPKAFRGAFPAQVRFKVHKDCFPLPETVFKKAIKENYYAKNKFRTELTFKQVKKLTELYRSAEFHHSHSSKRRIHTPPRIHSRREWHARSRDLEYEDSFANGDSRSFHSLPRERKREIFRRELSPIRREEIRRDLYLSKKDYQSFGLQGERRNLAPSSRGSYETLQRDYDREPIPRQPEYCRIEPLYLEEKEHLAYGLRSDLASSSLSQGVRSSYTNDPYLVHRRDVPPLDPHPPLRKEEAELAYSHEGRSYMMETNRRIDSRPVDRLYSTYASDPLSQAHDFHVARRETSTMPVSSRYSFAGPSFSYH